MLESGVDLKTVSSALGHKTIGMTGDVYLHVTEAMQQSAADQLDRHIAAAASVGNNAENSTVVNLRDQSVTIRGLLRRDLCSNDGGEGGSRTHMSCLGRF